MQLMMKKYIFCRLLLTLLILLLLISSIYSYPFPVKKYEAFLNQFVKNGLIDYKAVKLKPKFLNEIVKTLETAYPGNYIAAKQAFWVNAYNITVIKSIIERYPDITSTIKVPGFFNINKHLIAGLHVTLDEIQKKILMGLKRDSRYHFALNCGAKSCPILQNFVYTPLEIERQFQFSQQNFLKSHYAFRLSGNSLMLNELFSWYQEDFGGIEGLKILFKELVPDIKNRTISFFSYDWSLNSRE
jgi:hypothetical protein